MTVQQPCVLLVEDEGAQREVLTYNLESEGFRVVAAETGDEAMLLVADRENNRVQVFDRGGRLLDVWAGMHKPMDVAVDDRGMVLVSDQVPRIHALRLDGSVAGRGCGRSGSRARSPEGRRRARVSAVGASNSARIGNSTSKVARMRPIRRVASSGQADCGKGEPSGWLWWISSCMFRPSTSSAA